jgi:MFS family permease
MKTNDKRVLVTSVLGSGLDDMNVMFLSFSLSSIIADLNLSGSEAGWIGTITNLGMLVGGLFFGVLADRYNKFHIFKITVLLFSLATGFIYFVDNIYALYLLRFISGVGVGGEYGVAISIMAGIVPLNKMGRIASLNGIVGQ